MKLTAPLQIKSLNSEDGDRTFEGYGAFFSNVDRVGDVIRPGAFGKSLEDHKSAGTTPALCLHHDLKRPIGTFTSIGEDASGLAVQGKLTTGVRDADEAYALLKDGALHSMSIGYRVVDEEYDAKSGINYLNEINVHEISLVTIPANAAAVVTSVKDADGNPDIRELEKVLRDAGLSRKEAKAVLSCGFKALEEVPVSAEEAEQVKRDAEAVQALLTKLTER
jgi:HK97 family phage prohead protease